MLSPFREALLTQRFGALTELAQSTGFRLEERDLAGKVGVTYAYIALLETGKKSNPSLDLVKKLAKALGVSVSDLLDGR